MARLSADLVIFDCDGVLVDTEPVTLRVMAAWCAANGFVVPEDRVAATFKGVHISRIQAAVEAGIGRAVPGFVEGFRVRMFEAFEAGVAAVPGAAEVLDALEAAGVQTCVASNGPYSKMAASLTSSGLAGRLGATRDGVGRFVPGPRVLSADDVANPKPAPDLFLQAARRFGVTPGRCVVVEDSPSGVVAARAAGMRCVAYSDLTPAEELEAEGPEVVVRSMREVLGVFGVG